MAHRWYVVHAYSGFENKVAQSIREQAEKKGLAEEISKTNNADSGDGKIEQHVSAVRTYRSLYRQQDPLTVYIHWPSRET